MENVTRSEMCLNVVERFYVDTTITKYYISNVIVVIVNILMAPPTIILNLLVIVIVLRYKHLQITCNMFLCGLAITDLLNGLLLQTSFIAIHVMSLQRNIECNYYVFVAGVAFSVLFMSMGGLMVITTDRYLAIFHPYWYAKRTIDRNTAVKVIMTNTALAITLGVASMYSKDYLLFNILFPLMASLLMPWSLYVHKKALTAIRRIRATEQKQVDSVRNRNQVNNRKTSRVALLVLLAMTICYGPEGTLNVLRYVMTANDDFRSAQSWATTMMNANSLVNPLIYCWKLRSFRTAMRHLVSRDSNAIHGTFSMNSSVS